MQKIRISIVSFLNTVPLLYGIEKTSELFQQIDLHKDIPSVCAVKLTNNAADIGLIPVAAIPFIANAEIVSKYVIGAVGAVKSVLLVSDVPLNQITAVYLDYQSRTSIQLVKVLAKHHWHITPNWIPAQPDYETEIRGTKAGIIIGDRTFHLPKHFEYSFDLATEWIQFTELPFVFACWVANKPIKKDFLNKFDEALGFGVRNIRDVVNCYKDNYNITETEMYDYLTQNISFHLDDRKKEAMSLFLKLLNKL